MNLVSMLESRAELERQTPAITFLHNGGAEERTHTAESLCRRARILAAELKRTAGSGTPVLLFYSAGLEFVEAFLACLYAGVPAVPLPIPANDRVSLAVSGILKDVGTRFAATTTKLLSRLFRAAGQSTALGKLDYICTDAVEPAHGGAPRDPLPGEIAYLQYTSGSTGDPKGIVISHSNLEHNLRYIDLDFVHMPDSVGVSWLPHFHDMGLVYGVLAPLFFGFHGYLLSPGSFLQQPRCWLDAITRYGATHSGGPNFAYDLCRTRISEEQRANLDLRRWRVAYNGAEPVRKQTLDGFARDFESCGFRADSFYPAYGLAESTLKVTSRPMSGPVQYRLLRRETLARGAVSEAQPEEANAIAAVSCGRASFGTTVIIVDPETLGPRADEEVGEVLVSGPSVAVGMWNGRDQVSVSMSTPVPGYGVPFLKTGDLGFLSHGELYITGRLKDLIIVNGQNHYPEDIEATVRSASPAEVRAVVAFSKADDSRSDTIVVMQEVATEDGGLKQRAQSIRDAVAQVHGVRVDTIVFVPRGAVSMTTSGKPQRKRNAAKYERGEIPFIAIDRLPPGSKCGAALQDGALTLMDRAASIVAGVLGIDVRELHAGSSVIALGADSLLAAQIAHGLNTSFGTTLTAADILAEPRLERIVEQLAEGAADSNAVPAAEKQELYPASLEQERLWALHQLFGGKANEMMRACLRIDGPLNIEALERSLKALVRRHESLRTTFEMHAGVLRLAIHEELDPLWEFRDAPAEPEENWMSVAQTAAETWADRSVDLLRGPLVRAALVRFRPEIHFLNLLVHHAAADGMSLHTMIEELGALYDTEVGTGGLNVHPPAAPYSRYAEWQRSQRKSLIAAHGQFWAEILADPAVPSLDLLAQTVQKSGSAAVPAPTMSEISAFACAHDATPFMVILAAWFQVMRRRTRQDEMAVAVPFDGRPTAEFKGSVGLYAYPLIVRVNLANVSGFREILGRVRESAIAAYHHAALPFSGVVELARDVVGQIRNVIPSVMLTHLRLPQPTLPGSIQFTALRVEAPRAGFGIVLLAQESGDELQFNVSYDPAVFTREAVSDLLAELEVTLAAGAGRQEVTLASQVPREQSLNRELVVLASFTADPIRRILDFWCSKLRFASRSAIADAGQWFSGLADKNSLIHASGAGARIVLVRAVDLAGKGTASAEEFQAGVALFAATLKRAVEVTAGPWIVCVCPDPPAFSETAAASFDGGVPLLEAGLAACPGIEVVNHQDVLRWYPVAEWCDLKSEELARIPFTDTYFAGLATTIARRLVKWIFQPIKMVIVDADGTLWNGAAAELGATGVSLDEGRRRLQERLRELQEAGMLLAICSRNRLEDVEEVFAAHQEFPLGNKHFVAVMANWERKSEHIRKLGAQFRFSGASFLILDDNAAECAEMKAAIPDAAVVALPDRDLETFAAHLWPLDSATATEEDVRRTQAYREAASREQFRRSVPTLREFLAQLDLHVEVRPMATGEEGRVAQLTQRVNQFNFSLRRRQASEILRCVSEGGLECRIVTAWDRFGDYGLCGAILLRAEGDELSVDTFLLSCRALWRGIEHRMLATVGELALQRGCSQVRFDYRRGERNQPVAQFIRSVAAIISETGGSTFCVLDATAAASARYEPADVEPVLEAQEPAQCPADERPGAGGIDWTGIATHLNTPERILACVTGKPLPRSRSASTALSPRQAQLAALWRELLNVTDVRPEDNFFELGGDSLLAIRLLSRIQEELGFEIPVEILFQRELTLGELSSEIENIDPATTLKAILQAASAEP